MKPVCLLKVEGHFTVSARGTVIAGEILTGAVNVGDEIEQPGTSHRIRVSRVEWGSRLGGGSDAACLFISEPPTLQELEARFPVGAKVDIFPSPDAPAKSEEPALSNKKPLKQRRPSGCLLALIGIPLLLWGSGYAWLRFADYDREVFLVEQSGLDIERKDLEKVFHDEVSARFGAEGRSRFVFQLPEAYSGLERCGLYEFTPVREMKYLPGGIELQDGCYRGFKTKDGTTFRYRLFDRQLAIQVYY